MVWGEEQDGGKQLEVQEKPEITNQDNSPAK